MPPHSSRRFQLADALILIGGVAVAIAIIRRNWELYYANSLLVAPPDGWSPGVLLNRCLTAVSGFGGQGAAAFTAPLLAIRLCEPRPPLPRLARQPGFVASVAVILAIVLSEAEYLARVRILGVENPFRSGLSAETCNMLIDGLNYALARNGYVVAAAWLTLALGRRWRPEPGWIDGWGRALGAFWILMIPVYAWMGIVGRW